MSYPYAHPTYAGPGYGQQPPYPGQAPPQPYHGAPQHPPAAPYGQYPQYTQHPPPPVPVSHYPTHPPPPQPTYGHPPPPVAAPPMHPQQPAYGAGIVFNGARLANDPLNPYATVPPSLPGYDPNMDAEAIRKATKGFGTNENQLNRILCLRSADQIQVLEAAYKVKFGKDLTGLVKSEVSGYYEKVLVAIIAGPLFHEVECLHAAVAGAGTKESVLTELLIGRHPNDLMALRAAYTKKYNKSMDQVVLDDLSMKTRDAFNIALQGRWQDNGYPDPALLQQDVHQLMGMMRFGRTDEIGVSSILLSRSPIYLQALNTHYFTASRKHLTKEIKQHFSGHLQAALLHAVNGGKKDGTGVWRDAKLLERSMAGMGTKDEQLLRRLVRYHWDQHRFAQIKQAYQIKYKKTLKSRVQGETSGHFKDALVTMIDGV